MNHSFLFLRGGSKAAEDVEAVGASVTLDGSHGLQASATGEVRQPLPRLAAGVGETESGGGGGAVLVLAACDIDFPVAVGSAEIVQPDGEGGQCLCNHRAVGTFLEEKDVAKRVRSVGAADADETFGHADAGTVSHGGR